MPTHGQWADLGADLVSRIAAFCTLQGYVSCRAVCGAWRAVLPSTASWPLAPFPDDDGTAGQQQPLSLGVCSPHAQCWTRLLGLPQPSRLLKATRCRCIGARDGWVALAATGAETGTSVLLFNPLTRVEIPLHASLYDPRFESAAKVVFSSSPTPRDFAAVSICRPNTLGVQRTTDGYSSSFNFDTDKLMDSAVLADIAYVDDGKVFCLTDHGVLYVLRLNRRRRRGGHGPVEVKPLVPRTHVFPAPYETVSRFTDNKNLVLCDGVLYQVWRRPSGAGSALVPARICDICDQQLLRISESDVFVLKYDPRRRPFWAVTKDLGGHTVFLGTNDAAAVHGCGATELLTGRGNRLYYWDKRPEGGYYEAVLHDMATGRSMRWLPSTGGVRASSPLWYFLPAGVMNAEETAEDAAAGKLHVSCDEVSIVATV